MARVPGEWSLRWCAACRLGWLDPRPDPAGLYDEYYTHAGADPEPVIRRRLGWRVTYLLRSAFRPTETLDRHSGWVGLVQEAERALLAGEFGYAASDARPWVGRLAGAIPAARERVGAQVMFQRSLPRGRLADVGCGAGELVALMARLGWQACGVDPDPKAVEAGRRRFREARLSVGTAADLPAARFDVVVLHHVIEHVADPTALLSEAARLTAPGGRLVVATPNAESAGHRRYGRHWRDLDPPRHLVLFARTSLVRCAERAGLRVDEVRTSRRLAAEVALASRLIRRHGRVRWSRVRLSDAFAAAAAALRAPRDDAAGEELFLTASQGPKSTTSVLALGRGG